MKKLLMLAVTGVVGLTQAGEEWSGSDLTIYGSRDPDETYVKLMDDEVLSASNLYVGNTNGSAALVANDSTLTLSGTLCIGYERSPGYKAMTAAVTLTNSTVTCASVRLGDGMTSSTAGSTRMELGPGSVVNTKNVNKYCNPTPWIFFTGGRFDFSAKTSGYLFTQQGWTWGGSWPNTGTVLKSVDAPIDLTVEGTCKLTEGWASRSLTLEGNGGFVKRGSGTLLWGWYTTGSNDGYVQGNATYTGDTVIKAGGIRLATPSTATKAQIRYSVPPASPLKIEEGAFFDFAGNNAAWVSVSGAGMITNSEATAATLTLGLGNGDCALATAAVGGPIKVVKGGTGTLTVSTAGTLAELVVSNGVTKLMAGTTLGAATVKVLRGATLDIRGATLVCPDLVVEKGGNFYVDGTTHFDEDLVADEAMTIFGGRYASAGTFRKLGTGAVTMYAPCERPNGRFEIAEGSVKAMATAVFPGRYYRVNYFKDVGRNTADGVGFAEFSLYGVAGGRINQGTYTYNKITNPSKPYSDVDGIDDATVLAEREVNWWGKGNDYYINGAAKPQNAFDGDLSTTTLNTWYWDGSNTLVFRVPDDTPPAVGFTFTTSASPLRRPTQWKLWGSENGKDWVMLANNITNTGDAAVWTYLTNSTPDTAKTEYNGGFPYFLNDVAIAADYAPFGMSTVVAVAKDATLDFEKETMTLSRLEVDCTAGSGSITRFTPAADGALYLVNVPAGQELVGYEPPIAIGAIGDDANFRTWKVYVGGVERNDLRVRWRNGKLTILAKGLYLFVR